MNRHKRKKKKNKNSSLNQYAISNITHLSNYRSIYIPYSNRRFVEFFCNSILISNDRGVSVSGMYMLARYTHYLQNVSSAHFS